MQQKHELLGVLNNEFVFCHVGLVPADLTWLYSLHYVRACFAVGVTAVNANFENLYVTR